MFLVRRAGRAKVALGMSIVLSMLAAPAAATLYRSTWALSSTPLRVTADKATGATYGSWALDSIGWMSRGYVTVRTSSTTLKNTRSVYVNMRTYTSSGTCTTGVSGGLTILKTLGISGGVQHNCTFDWGDTHRVSTPEFSIQTSGAISTYIARPVDGTNPRGNGAKAVFSVCIQRPWPLPDTCSVEAQSAAYTLPVTQIP